MPVDRSRACRRPLTVVDDRGRIDGKRTVRVVPAVTPERRGARGPRKRRCNGPGNETGSRGTGETGFVEQLNASRRAACVDH